MNAGTYYPPQVVVVPPPDGGRHDALTRLLENQEPEAHDFRRLGLGDKS